jgi:hypothetical protein
MGLVWMRRLFIRVNRFVLRSSSSRHKLAVSLCLDRVATNQGVQARLGHFVILILVVTVAFVVVASVHQVNYQDCAFAHGIQLETGFQDIISIENACREVEINIGILEREASLAEMLVMDVCQFFLFHLGIGAIEDEDAFAERQAKLFPVFFWCDAFDCC